MVIPKTYIGDIVLTNTTIFFDEMKPPDWPWTFQNQTALNDEITVASDTVRIIHFTGIITESQWDDLCADYVSPERMGLEPELCDPDVRKTIRLYLAGHCHCTYFSSTTSYNYGNDRSSVSKTIDCAVPHITTLEFGTAHLPIERLVLSPLLSVAVGEEHISKSNVLEMQDGWKHLEEEQNPVGEILP